MRKVELKWDERNDEWRVLVSANAANAKDTEHRAIMCWCNVGLPCHEGCAAFYRQTPGSLEIAACSALPSGQDEGGQGMGELVPSSKIRAPA